jgi:hypothetical protein
MVAWLGRVWNAVFTLLSVTAGLLNRIGLLVALGWFVVLGRWWVIGGSLLAYFVSIPVILGIGMPFLSSCRTLSRSPLTQLPFVIGRFRFGLGLFFLASYLSIALAAWCSGVFYVFLKQADPRSLIPLLIMSQVVATKQLAGLVISQAVPPEDPSGTMALGMYCNFAMIASLVSILSVAIFDAPFLVVVTLFAVAMTLAPITIAATARSLTQAILNEAGVSPC